MSRQESRTRSKVFTVYPLLLVLLGGGDYFIRFWRFTGTLQGGSNSLSVYYGSE